MKRAILILSIVAILLLVIGLVVVVGAGASVAANCTTDASGHVSCPNGAASSGAVGGAAIGILLLVLGLLSTGVAWIMGLIKTAQLKAWGWFVAVLLVPPLGSLIYGIAGPDQAPMPQYASPQYPQQSPPQQSPPQQSPPQQSPQQYPPQSPPQSYR